MMEELIRQIKEALGNDIAKVGAEVPEHQYSKDFSLRGVQPEAVVLPRSASDVAIILKLCNKYRQPIVLQGGMSGLAAAAVPSEGELVMSMSRLREIEEIDVDAGTMTVQAGAVLQSVQEAAAAKGMMFPLDLGGRGSCQVGGMAATNAGGNRVLRYGMARDLILGIEAVLPTGEIISSLNKMQKNNTGYDIKQLFIGSEGTLGVITKLVLRIFPEPAALTTAFCVAPDYPAVLKFLHRCKRDTAGALSAFEVMWPDFYDVATRTSDRPAPLKAGKGLYILIEVPSVGEKGDDDLVASMMMRAIEEGELADAVVAQSLRETENFWALRDTPGEFRQTFWPNIAFDVSLPIGDMNTFVDRCRARLNEQFPGAETVFFGHIADSNVHIVVRLDLKPFPSKAVEKVIYGTVAEFKGSVSAEHGIGLIKKDYLHYSRSEQEIELMRTLKKSLDPNHVLNPGRIFSLNG